MSFLDFNSVSLSFAGMYSRHVLSEWTWDYIIMIIWGLKTNLSVWAWLRFDLNFVYEKALLWQRNESMANFFFQPRPIYNISITSGFYLISFCFSIKVSRVWSYKVVLVWRKGGMGTTEYDEHRFSCPRSVKLSLIVQTTKYFQFLFRTTCI